MNDENNRVVHFLLSLAQMEKSIHRFRSSAMKTYQLQGPDFLILMALYDHPEGLQARELQQLSRMDKAMVSRCLDRLSKRSFVYSDREEGRYKGHYMLSRQGIEITEEISTVLEHLHADIHERLDDQAFNRFYEVVSTVIDLLDQGVEDGWNDPSAKQEENS